MKNGEKIKSQIFKMFQNFKGSNLNIDLVEIQALVTQSNIPALIWSYHK